MPQYTKTFLTREANRFGAEVTVNDNGGGVSIIVDSPDGQIWKGNGTHKLSASGLTEEEIVKDLLERMADGLDDCPDPECDICEDQSEEEEEDEEEDDDDGEEEDDGDGGDGDGEPDFR